MSMKHLLIQYISAFALLADYTRFPRMDEYYQPPKRCRRGYGTVDRRTMMSRKKYRKRKLKIRLQRNSRKITQNNR